MTRVEIIACMTIVPWSVATPLIALISGPVTPGVRLHLHTTHQERECQLEPREPARGLVQPADGGLGPGAGRGQGLAARRQLGGPQHAVRQPEI